MTFCVEINDSNGISSHEINTESSGEALNFLGKHDHEGSTISMYVSFNETDSELIYETLGKLVKP